MSNKSRKSTKRDKIKHSGKHSGKAIRRNKVGGGAKGSWKDVPDFEELSHPDIHEGNEKKAPFPGSQNQKKISKSKLTVNTENKKVKEQVAPSMKTKQLFSTSTPLLSADRINMEPQLLQHVPLLQFPGRISIKPHTNDSKSDVELIAIACSNLTNSIWDGQITLVEASSDMSEVSFRQNIATYGGNTSVGWIGELLLCGGDDGVVYAWQLKKNDDSETKAYDPSSPTFSVDSDQKENDQLPELEHSKKKIQQDDAPAGDLILPYPMMVVSFWDHFDCVSAIDTSCTFPEKLMTGSWDHTAKLWDAEHSSDPAMTYQHNKPVLDVKWNPHESHCHTVLTSACDGIFMWDIRSASSYVNGIQSSNAIYSLAWDTHSPHFFATGSEDGCVNIMDLRMLGTHNSLGSSALLATHTEGKGTINAIQYSPFCSGLIATTCNDTVTRILQLNHEELTTVWTCQGKDYGRDLQWSSENPSRLMITSWDLNKAIAVYDSLMFDYRSH